MTRAKNWARQDHRNKLNDMDGCVMPIIKLPFAIIYLIIELIKGIKENNNGKN